MAMYTKPQKMTNPTIIFLFILTIEVCNGFNEVNEGCFFDTNSKSSKAFKVEHFFNWIF